MFNVNARLEKADDWDTLGRTPSQRIYELLQFKKAEEQRMKGGKMGAQELYDAWSQLIIKPESKFVEKVSLTFVEYALLVHERLLSDPVLRDITLDVDGRYGQASPLTVQNLREIVRVGKTKKYIEWELCTLRDLVDSAVYSYRDLGSRALASRLILACS